MATKTRHVLAMRISSGFRLRPYCVVCAKTKAVPLISTDPRLGRTYPVGCVRLVLGVRQKGFGDHPASRPLRPRHREKVSPTQCRGHRGQWIASVVPHHSHQAGQQHRQTKSIGHNSKAPVRAGKTIKERLPADSTRVVHFGDLFTIAVRQDLFGYGIYPWPSFRIMSRS